MRRIVLAITLALLSILGTGVLAPVSRAHAHATPTPTVMVTSTSVTQGSTTTISGIGFAPNYYAYVYFQRPDGTFNAFNITTDSTGSFTFTLGFSSSHGTGNEYLSAYDYVSNRWTSFVTISVTAGTPTPPPTVRQLSASPNPVGVGQITTITGTGFTPNNYVYFYYQRPDGTTNAFYIYTSPTGAFTQQLGFLPSHRCGNETVAAYDYGTAVYSTPYTITLNGC